MHLVADAISSRSQMDRQFALDVSMYSFGYYAADTDADIKQIAFKH